MKTKILLLLCSFLLLSMQCDDNDPDIPEFTLEQKNKEIIDYINSFSCSETAGCGFIAFGSKPCGGPKTYLLFSNGVDIVKLKQMVATYNEMDQENNIKTGAISDCMLRLPPTEVKCVNGVCTIIK